ncbi:VrrA/YqfQ family protein [Bacillus sp. SCS-153A]|uniref:VrrA/YqfQ family protein n=1 Tax=Rossellomorea sedimentorum TaxID=3115294 RepID=UPI003905AEAE
MPPRQQMPFNPHSFGQQPFHPMRGMRGPGPSGFGMMRPRGMQGNFSGGPGRKSGGLLAKILNKGGSSQGAASQFNPLQGAAGFQRSTPASGGSLLKNILNPGSLNGFLNNTQQVLKTAQQVGPMIQQVQQYGPLVRNLPAMWKLYRGLSAAETEEEETQDESNDEIQEKESVEAYTDSQLTDKRPKNKQKKARVSKGTNKAKTQGGSQPKLYV